MPTVNGISKEPSNLTINGINSEGVSVNGGDIRLSVTGAHPLMCFDAGNARFKCEGVDLSPFARADNDYILTVKDSADKAATGLIDLPDSALALGADLFDQYKGTFDLTNIRGSERNSGNLTVGTIYEISAQTDAVFTNDGAPNNDVGTTFTATATTVTLDAGDKVYPLTIRWNNYGTNQVSIDDNALKITYVDNASGALVYFRDSNDLSSNFTVNKLYKLTFKAKVGAGDTVNFKVEHPASGFNITTAITETSFTSKTIYFISPHATDVFIHPSSMGPGDIIWLDNIVLSPVTYVGIDGSTIMSTKNGSTQSWTDIESGFNCNDSSGYTFEITSVSSDLVVNGGD